jgi:hypothetical protein
VIGQYSRADRTAKRPAAVLRTARLPATAALDLRPVCAAHHDFVIVLLTQIMHEFDVRSS